jgi:hypothetical protein
MRKLIVMDMKRTEKNKQHLLDVSEQAEEGIRMTKFLYPLHIAGKETSPDTGFLDALLSAYSGIKARVDEKIESEE